MVNSVNNIYTNPLSSSSVQSSNAASAVSSLLQAMATGSADVQKNGSLSQGSISDIQKAVQQYGALVGMSQFDQGAMTAQIEKGLSSQSPLNATNNSTNGSSGSGSALSTDLKQFLQDLASGNTAALQKDFAKLKTDLQNNSSTTTPSLLS